MPHSSRAASGSESRLPDSWLIAAICAALVGAVVTPVLTVKGLRQLAEPALGDARMVSASAFAGGAGAAVAAQAARHAGSPWWLPALGVWALTLVAAAACDALTQRIPTPLLRRGALLTAALVALAGLVTHDGRALLVTVVACAAAGTILGICWRFAGAGFGDVRLATVGGLGLGHTTHRALALAVLACALASLAQAIWTYTRSRDPKACFAYGPALVVGFLVAVAV